MKKTKHTYSCIWRTKKIRWKKFQIIRACKKIVKRLPNEISQKSPSTYLPHTHTVCVAFRHHWQIQQSDIVNKPRALSWDLVDVCILFCWHYFSFCVFFLFIYLCYFHSLLLVLVCAVINITFCWFPLICFFLRFLFTLTFVFGGVCVSLENFIFGSAR